MSPPVTTRMPLATYRHDYPTAPQYEDAPVDSVVVIVWSATDAPRVTVEKPERP